MTKLGQFRLKDESPSSGSSLQPGSLFFNRDNATKSSPSLKGKTNLLILRLAKLCWISSLRSIEKFFSNLKDFCSGFCLPCFQASCNNEKNALTFFFLSPLLVSPQSQKLTYAAATLQTGGSSTSTEQAASSNSASQQVQDITSFRQNSFRHNR